MAVSAGAGSGKTTSLVGRVAALVATPGVRLDQIVVITFTEKAAREVSHRLRRAIGNSVPLDEAFIGTIHGFCQSLLRRYPIEAGLPPKFTTADELTSGAMADERAEQAVQTLYNLALKKPADRRSVGGDRLVRGHAVPSRSGQGDRQRLAALRRSAAASRRCRSPSPRPRSCACSIRSAPTSATSRRTGECEPNSTQPWPRPRRRWSSCNRCRAWPPRPRRSTSVTAAPAAAWAPFRAAMRFACFEPALRQLMAALTPIVIEMAAERIARGELSFDDLLVLTRRLLQTRPEVRAAVRARHRYLFVDEFQDTDQVQFDVLTELTSPDPASSASSMFAVGDPKQSIYGFRNADVELFSSLLAADPGSQQLTVNRRTRADVCAWINAVLAHRFVQVDDDAEADHQVAFTPLEPQRSANIEADGPGVVVLGMPGWSKLDHETAEDTARAEAADIAALVQRVVAGDEPWMVGDDGPDQRRAAGQLPRHHRADPQQNSARRARTHPAPSRRAVPGRGWHPDLRIARGLRAAPGAARSRRPDQPAQGRHRAAHLDLRDRRPPVDAVPPRRRRRRAGAASARSSGSSPRSRASSAMRCGCSASSVGASTSALRPN